ncbi:hypothetical protein BGW38_010230, partial [Lunasporangiospora selenospora]
DPSIAKAFLRESTKRYYLFKPSIARTPSELEDVDMEVGSPDDSQRRLSRVKDEAVKIPFTGVGAMVQAITTAFNDFGAIKRL